MRPIDLSPSDVQQDNFWQPLSFGRVYAGAYPAEWQPPPRESNGAKGDGGGKDAAEPTDDDDSEVDDSGEDEWHLQVPGGTRGGGVDGGDISDLFTGFTFKREKTMLGKRADDTPTRLGRLRRRMHQAGETPLKTWPAPEDGQGVPVGDGDDLLSPPGGRSRSYTDFFADVLGPRDSVGSAAP